VKTREVIDNDGNLYGWEIRCPACDKPHVIRDRAAKDKTKASWDFNGNRDRPTFTPSLKLCHDGFIAKDADANETNVPPFVCHSVITDGMIAYQNDCTHAMAGQTVELPDLKEVPC
jgi:hypothetical protein